MKDEWSDGWGIIFFNSNVFMGCINIKSRQVETNTIVNVSQQGYQMAGL